MGRFLTSARGRNFLYWSQKEKCARCGEDLGEDWEAHHIERYGITKRTNVHEMEALCVRCHRALHQEERKRQND